MRPIQPTATARARRFLSEGWEPGEDIGVIWPKSDKDRGVLHLVDDDVWRVMVMLTLEVR
jgi:hypothetical protein